MKKISLIISIVSLCAVHCASITRSAGKGDLEKLKEFVESGIDVNAKGNDKFHSPPLVIAAGNGHTDIVVYLISKGADVNAYNDIGFTALINTARYGVDIRIAEMLIEAGADVNRQSFTKGGETALMLAVEYRHNEMVKYLLSKKADVKIMTKFGKKALDYAVYDSDMIRMLISNGAAK